MRAARTRKMSRQAGIEGIILHNVLAHTTEEPIFVSTDVDSKGKASDGCRIPDWGGGAEAQQLSRWQPKMELLSRKVGSEDGVVPRSRHCRQSEAQFLVF